MSLFVLWAVVCGRAAWASEGSAPVEALVARAHELKLAESPQWRRLVHYQSALFGWRSEADGPAFFLAKDGKTNPRAELEATVRAVFAGPSEPTGEGGHAACRFPARRAVLMKALQLEPSQWPAPPCPELAEFVGRVAARSVTLSFSTYYLGNPSSVFGHTFLRLNRDEQLPDGRQKELLDWGVNFGGAVNTTDPVLYGLRGLTGGYRGEFLSMPYYYKVREYNDFESRDLWEYRLSLRPEEVDLLVLHLWELGHTWFDYFYIDENCSWHLLTALEAAAPRLDLSKYLRAAVLPGDAVRVVWNTPGLVESVHYRPSLRTQFERRASELDPLSLRALEALQTDPKAPVEGSKEVQAAVLDAAMDLLDVRHAKDLVFKTAPEVEEQRHRLMVRRARLGLPSADLDGGAPAKDAPHLSHGSGRLGIGGGVSGGEPFARLSYRLLLHDLQDPQVGYPRYLRMEVLPLELRYAPRTREVALEQLDLFRMEYLPAVTRFSLNASHATRIGLTTVRDGGCDGCLVGRIEGAGGLSTEPFPGGPLLFALGTAAVAGGPDLAGVLGGPVRPSLGARVGMRWHLTGWLSALATADGWLHGESRIRPAWTASGGARLHLSKLLSLDLEARRLEEGPEFGASLYLYY